MKIEKKEVEHIARLARLKLNEEEKERFGHQLDQILKYIEKLNELNTKGVEPAFHIVPLQNVMRKDKAEDSLPIKNALANAPATKGNYFKVPRIIE
jgi:aspartyl-tRNA(Asn)/glutamyl-tRNA(Gln) amidotransferase subunit C